MGADIRTEGHHAVVRGVPRLSAAPVRALDIRAGAAMVIAALCADGVTEIADVHHIDRGYEDFEDKLTGARRRGPARAATRSSTPIRRPSGDPAAPGPPPELPPRRRPRCRRCPTA